MLLIYCPHCCEYRDEEEFSYSGEAHISRPTKPESMSDEEWGDYLFFTPIKILFNPIKIL